MIRIRMRSKSDRREKILEILKQRRDEGVCIRKLAYKLHINPGDITSSLKRDDMIYEDKRKDGTYLVWCGE